MASPELEKSEERWPVTVSVSAAILNGNRQVLLIHKRKNGLWGLPAGGVKGHEYLLKALWREILEETDKTPDDFELAAPEYAYPHRILENLRGEKTSLGFMYILAIKNPVNSAGYYVANPEIDYVKPFSQVELAELMSHPEMIYKTEFNLAAFSEIQSWWNEF